MDNTPALVQPFPHATIRTKARASSALFAICVALVAPRVEAAIPSARLIDWTANVAVGVPGGIPYRNGTTLNVTDAPYNADPTGTDDASLAIQAAVNAARPGDVVLIPEGRYRINRPISVGANRDNITIRGAGIDVTTIDTRTNTAFSIGSSSDYQWAWPSSGNTIISPTAKGSTQIELESASAFAIGQLVAISYSNQEDTDQIRNGATPVVSVFGYPRARRQLTRVVGKSGNTLSISPSLYFSADPGVVARVNIAQQTTDFSGIEGLTVDGTNGQMIFPIIFEQSYACWLKDVKVKQTANYGIYLTNSFKCEIRGMVIVDRKTGGSNGAGILCGTVSASLFEDNIILNIFPGVEVNFSSTGNVFGYNLMENPAGGTLNTNHGPHNSFNLYEGNVTPNIQSDGYFGSASDDTFFRNWIHGTNIARTIRTFRVSLNRFTRNYSLVGNIIGEAGGTATGVLPYSFGNPNMGNAIYTGTAKPSAGDFWDDWGATATVTTRTSNTAGTITLNKGKMAVGQFAHLVWGTNRLQFTVSSVTGNAVTFTTSSGSALPNQGDTVSVFMGPNGYQELDLDVGATTYLLGNYNYNTRSIPASESLAGTTLPASMYRTSKPAFFGTLPWPAFDSTNPNPNFTSIPAGFRQINGTPAPESTATSLPAAPSALKVLPPATAP